MNSATFPHVTAPAGHVSFAKAAYTQALGWVKPVANWIDHEVAVRAAVRELRRMDDRSLADIGICRGEINTVVRGRR